MVLNVLSVSLSMSAVILVLTLMRKHINKKYSARVMCMIWLFVALRLLIPVEIDLPVSKVNLELNMDQIITEVDLPAIEIPEFHNTIQLDQTIKVEETVMPAANFSISWHDAVTCVWLAGAVCMMMKQVLAYCSISKWLKRNSVYEKTIDGVKVYLSSALPEPLSFGTFKSSIYLTEQFRTDNWVLNHELMHCKHYDGLMMWIAAFVKSIHWFNRLVYYMDKQWEANRELYCDEAVLKDKTKSERIEYMVTLYDAAEAMTQQRLRFTSGLLDGEHQMVERFKQIKRSEFKRKGRVLMFVFSALILFSSALVGCTDKNNLFNHMIQLIEEDEMITFSIFSNCEPYVVENGLYAITAGHADLAKVTELPLPEKIYEEYQMIEELVSQGKEIDEVVLSRKRSLDSIIHQNLKKINQYHDELSSQIVFILENLRLKNKEKFEVIKDDKVVANIRIEYEDGRMVKAEFYQSGQLMVRTGKRSITTFIVDEKEIYEYNLDSIYQMGDILKEYNYWRNGPGKMMNEYNVLNTD